MTKSLGESSPNEIRRTFVSKREHFLVRKLDYEQEQEQEETAERSTLVNREQSPNV
jgi:hypothetical protein